MEPRGHRLRPTTGIVREAIFNIVGDRVEGSRVLDLYAGTGALGIEALSRGALAATFVDAEAAAAQAILQTLSRTGMSARGRVFRGKLPGALASVTGPFDLILVDPPYGLESADDTLIQLAALLAPGGVIVYEHSSRYNPPGRPSGLTLTERRTYGDTGVAFYTHQPATLDEQQEDA